MIIIKNTILILLPLTLLTAAFWGCGEAPSSPPDVEFGSLEVYAYYDSSYVDSVTELPVTVQLLVPQAQVIIDDDLALSAFGDIPLTMDNILPGLHNIDVNWEGYTRVLQAEIMPNDTTQISTLLSKEAVPFTSPAMHFDPDLNELVFVDSMKLADYLPSHADSSDGEVILLFYFGAS